MARLIARTLNTRRLQRTTTQLAALFVALALGACERTRELAEIRYTEYGIAHVRANDYASLGFGQGYAQARDNLCKIEMGMLAFRGELSRYFGPDAAGSTLGGSSSLSSDLYFRGLNDSNVIEKLVDQPAPLGPRDEVRELVRGYVGGFNAFLGERHAFECSGAAWLRPMTEFDVYRRVYAITLLMGQGAMASNAIVSAEPPLASASAPRPERAAALADRFVRRTSVPGSNAIAIGSAASSTRGGLNLANPHLSWEMDMRWWQAQLTLPGQMNVSGATLIGVPLVVMGHTASVAWSITTAEKARRFTLFELELVDGKPTEYLVDGQAEAMQHRSVSVQVQRPDGSLETVTREQWSTRYGPLLGPGFIVELPAWGSVDDRGKAHAYAFRDANATNMRMLNTLFALNHARSVDDVLAAVRETQGVPWWTIVAADSKGQALFSQLHVVPNVTDAHAADCNTDLGTALFAGAGIAVLDGKRSACDWGSDPDAIEPGIFGPGSLEQPRMPLLRSTEYVENSNDSHWLPNATQRITGMPRIFGSEATERSLRTRDAITEITDQLAKGPFTRQALQDLALSNRSYAAELAVDDTVRACRGWQGGSALSSAGEPVALQAACEVLAKWDRRMNIDSRGALLFDRYWRRAVAAASGEETSLWTVPFDPEDPVRTPHTLAVDCPIVSQALADAVLELNTAGIALDAPLGEHQYIERGGKRIPLGGGGGGSEGVLGVFNLLEGTLTAERGYGEPFDGSGYMHVVQFDETACPNVATLLTYSQASEPSSPHHSDQTELYSQRRWVDARFCEEAIAASPALEVLLVQSGEHAEPAARPPGDK